MGWQQVRALLKTYRSFVLLVVGLWLVTGCNSTRVPSGVSATTASALPPVPTSTPDFIAQGREVFLRVCAQCHGQNGP